MRHINKYKVHANYNSSTTKLPLRVLKFNRPKWDSVKKKLLFKQKLLSTKRIEFANVLVKTVPFKTISRVKRYFKNQLQTKKYVLSLFNNSFFAKGTKNTRLKKELMLSYLVKPLYKLDVLLWYLDYVSSSFEARQSINNSAVLVNNKSVKSNYCVKKGDIISILTKTSDFTMKSSSYIPNNMQLCFLEIDYYSNTIIIVKDLLELTTDDLSLLVEKNIAVNSLSTK
jgi:ribosomal protein S4